MWMLWLGVIVLLLKLTGIFSYFDELSWWWVAVPFVGAFIWFELFERRLGWDKKKAFDELEKAKQERIKRGAERKKPVRR
jgi:small Trp-rich protein